MTSPSPRLRVVGALLAASLLGAACGSDTTDTTDTAPATDTASSDTTSGTDTAPTASGSLDAAIKDFMFVPADLTVTTGTTITWTNEDRFGHTVTAGGPGAETGEFDLVLGLTSDSDTTGLMESYTFDTAGTFDFYCRYHPSMKGTVTVTG